MTEKEKGIILNRMRAIESEIVEFPLHGASLRSSLQEYCRLNERSKAFDLGGRCFLEHQYKTLKAETISTIRTQTSNLVYCQHDISWNHVTLMLDDCEGIVSAAEVIKRVTENLITATKEQSKNE